VVIKVVINLRGIPRRNRRSAFCFNMAPDADAIRRAHERAELPYETITEVATATPGDLFFQAKR
jgi:hypothetical protein